MFRRYSSYPTKIWKSMTVNNGTLQYLRSQDLPKDRIEDFVDFQMNFYVKHEITHRISGLVNDTKAMEEYRMIFKDKLSDPSYHLLICSEEHHNGVSNIVGVLTTKLVKRGDPNEDDIPKNVKSEGALKFFKILRDWNNLYPIPHIMKQYDLPSYFDGQTVSVHPDYRKCGITTEMLGLAFVLGKKYGVPMSGGWMTSLGSQKAGERFGLQTAYEISRDELSRKFNVPLDITPPTYKYMIKRLL